MMQDTKLNLTIGVSIIVGIALVAVLSKYDTSREIRKIAKAKNEIQALSKKIQEHYYTFGSFPRALTDSNLQKLIAELPTTDPFSSEKEPYRYVTEDSNFKIYSVGPNGVDDGGRASQGDRLLDIVVEFRKPPAKGKP